MFEVERSRFAFGWIRMRRAEDRPPCQA